jgi:hypothetical protein
VRFRFHTLTEENPSPDSESIDVFSADESPVDVELQEGRRPTRRYGTVAAAWVSACEVGTGPRAVVRAGKVLVSAEWCSTPVGLIEVQVWVCPRSFLCSQCLRY